MIPTVFTFGVKLPTVLLTTERLINLISTFGKTSNKHSTPEDLKELLRRTDLECKIKIIQSAMTTLSKKEVDETTQIIIEKIHEILKQIENHLIVYKNICIKTSSWTYYIFGSWMKISTDLDDYKNTLEEEIEILDSRTLMLLRWKK